MVIADAPGPARRPVSGCRGDGDVRADSVPGSVRRASAADADHRQAVAREPADDESQLRTGQRRLRGRHGAGGPVRPAPAAAKDADRLRHAARDRVGACGGRAGSRDVHRGPRASGSLHEPAAHLCRAATGDRVPSQQATHHGDDHEPMHLWGGRTWPGHRRTAGTGPSLAAAVLDHRCDRGQRAGPGRTDVRRRAACRSRFAA